MTVKQAIFLVGGRGTRLGALTRDIPKPLLEIAPGVRFLDVVVEEAARRGFTDIILLAGHLGEQVEAAYHGRTIHGATVEVIREPQPQGTGGALRFASERLDPWFVMANGDSLFEFNMRDLASRPPSDALGRLALREIADPARYGAVTLDGGRITQFHEKDPDLKGPAFINGGVYLLSREILGLVDGPCSIEQDIFPRLAASGELQGRVYDGYFLDIGLPDTYEQAQREIPPRRQRPCAFLDRDGVLNEDAGYTHKPEDLVWKPGVREAIRKLNETGYYVVVVSNQAGVARGYYAESDVDRFHGAMRRDLAEAGAHIDAFYYCPFHKDAAVDRYRADNHPDRKPNPGMIEKARSDWPIRSEGSFLVGDQDSDLAAAKAAGLPGYAYREGSLADLVDRILADLT